VCILNSNSDKQLFIDPYSKFDLLVAVDAIEEMITTGSENSFDALKNFLASKKDWLFGFLTYDLKNETENLTSENKDRLEFPGICFFQPRWILRLNNDGSYLEVLSLPDHDD